MTPRSSWNNVENKFAWLRPPRQTFNDIPGEKNEMNTSLKSKAVRKNENQQKQWEKIEFSYIVAAVALPARSTHAGLTTTGQPVTVQAIYSAESEHTGETKHLDMI